MRSQRSWRICPWLKKQADPLRFACLVKNIQGKDYYGHVTDIHVGAVTKERLYLVKYDDGDYEHVNADQVRALRSQMPQDWSSWADRARALARP